MLLLFLGLWWLKLVFGMMRQKGAVLLIVFPLHMRRARVGGWNTDIRVQRVEI